MNKDSGSWYNDHEGSATEVGLFGWNDALWFSGLPFADV